MSSEQELFHSLIRRLETATQRLETFVQTQASGSATTLDTKSPNSVAAETSPATAAEVELPLSVVAYDKFMATSVKHYLDASQTLGGAVQEQAEVIQRLVQLQRDFILMASQVRLPPMTDSGFTDSLKPLQECISNTDEIRTRHRADKALFEELSAISEGVGAFGWIVIEPTPVPYIQDMKDSAQFYVNRVLKTFKDKDPKHIEWVKLFISMLTDLAEYVKTYHRTGLSWNPKGCDIKNYQRPGAASGSAPPPAPTGAASSPAPPPPPPPVVAPPLPSTGGGSMTSVFQELNKGEAITAGLRKVSKEEMTHKNPALRSGAAVPAPQATPGKRAPPVPTKPRSLTKKKPPKCELVNDKWVVENYEGGEVAVETTGMRQSVYIFNCQNTTIQVQGKFGAITLDKCQKVGTVIDTVVATAEVINSKSVKLQITGQAPALLLDKCDGVEVYLSRECSDIEITTAKTSEINISLQGAEDDQDFKECPVPEQLRSVFKEGKLVTSPVEHAG
ncbi:suppressor of rasval19 [Dispira simplex]|nr:suppressor of rasval19 [Dispira simplex]